MECDGDRWQRSHRDEFLKSTNQKLQSEAWADSRRNPGELSPAEYVAIPEFPKVPER